MPAKRALYTWSLDHVISKWTVEYKAIELIIHLEKDHVGVKVCDLAFSFTDRIPQ